MPKVHSLSNILIYDPYSICGFYLAKDLITKGFHVTLLSQKKLIDSEIKFTENFDIDTMVVYDLEQGCGNNYKIDVIFKNCTQFIHITSLWDPNVFFDRENGFNYELQQFNLKSLLHAVAKDNSIPINTGHSWQCSENVIIEVCKKILEFLQNSDKRLSMNILDVELFVCNTVDYAEYFAKDLLNRSDSLVTLDYMKINLRDIFRIVIEELGAELEFCGRGDQEKGVIVDYNHEILEGPVDCNAKLRLGNTLIKINESQCHIVTDILTQGNFRIENPINENQMLERIKSLIKSVIHEYQ